MSEAHLFAIGILLAWLAGIRAYLTVFGVGLAGALGWLDLPEALQVTTSPWVLGISGVLALLEFFTDKIPGVDFANHSWFVNPWEGWAVQGWPVTTILRGKVMVDGGRLLGDTRDGRLVPRRISGDVLSRPVC